MVNDDSQAPYYSEQFQENVKNFSIYHLRYRQFESLEKAIGTVENGQSLVAIWFEKNFSTAIVKRTLASVNTMKTDDRHFIIDATASDKIINLTPAPSTVASLPMTTATTSSSTINLILIDENNTFTETNINDTTTEHVGIEDEYTADDQDEGNENNDDTEEWTDEEDNEEEILRQSTIKLYIDNSNMFYAYPIMDMLQYGSWNLLNRVYKDQGQQTLASPVQVKEIIYAEGTELPDFLLSGYMIGFIYLSQVTMTSQLLVLERKDGFFDRLIVAGAKHSLIFLSHIITNLTIAIIQIILMFFIGFVWYQIPNFGSYWLTLLLVFLQSTSSIMTGNY